MTFRRRDLFEGTATRVEVVDVSARDGLQAVSAVLSIEERARWIRALLAAGVPEVEAASFVSPTRVPQMAGAAGLLASLADLADRLWVLVPNRRGAEAALAAGARNVVCVLSATESHSRANLGRSIATVLAELKGTASLLEEAGARGRAAISMAWADPDEGPVPPARVVELCRELRTVGFAEVTLCDTLGGASPRAVAELVDALSPLLSPAALGLHLHDPFGTAAAAALAGFLSGVGRFDGSLGGLGGCPFASGARGNVDLEVLVRLFQGMGVATGVTAEALAGARRSCLGMLEEREGSEGVDGAGTGKAVRR